MIDFTGFHSRVVRKSIARVLTVINQTQKENLRKFYKVRAIDSLRFYIHSSSVCTKRHACLGVELLLSGSLV